MRIRLGPKRLTFLIIPDANRPVKRMKVAPLLLYSIPITFLLLIVIVLSLYVFHLKSIVRTHELNKQLHQQQSLLTVKNQTIEDLETQLIDLSEQAKQVQSKIEQLKLLEKELNELRKKGASEDHSAKANDQVSGTSTGSDIGGEQNPVDEVKIAEVNQDTRKSLKSLDQEIGTLSSRFKATKSSIIKETERLEKLHSTPCIWPVDKLSVTSPFGARIDPFTAKPTYHSGIDLDGETGDPVYATADGIVTDAGSDDTHGRNIQLKHSGGYRTRYLHLSKILVRKGDKVKQGEKIGLVGNTGRSTGSHLHYEVIFNNENIDPEPFLQFKRKEVQ